MPIVVGTNSYVTLAEAKAYLGDSVRASSWVFASAQQQTAALITAARIFETITWQGAKTVPSQALAWARTGVVDRYGNPVDPLVVPQDIKSGQIEFAFELYRDPSIAEQDGTGSNVQSVAAGSANVHFFRPTTGSRLPFSVWSLIGHYASGGAAASSFGLPVVGGVTGDCGGRSVFAGGSSLTVTEGLS